jgi:hypothetical protein
MPRAHTTAADSTLARGFINGQKLRTLVRVGYPRPDCRRLGLGRALASRLSFYVPISLAKRPAVRAASDAHARGRE